MAQGLTRRDSPGKVKRAARRHMRLARRTGNEAAINVAERIKAPVDELNRVSAEVGDRKAAVEDAFDDWTQDDRKLDANVRRTHRKCEDYDEDHPNAGTVQQVFSGRAPSEITSAPRPKEPELVGKLVKRGEGLPSDHPAAPLLPLLTEQAAASSRSHAAWTEAAKQVALAGTAVDIARLNVVRVYNDNLIDISRASGEEIAELCFPTLRRSGAADDEDDATTPNGAPAP